MFNANEHNHVYFVHFVPKLIGFYLRLCVIIQTQGLVIIIVVKYFLSQFLLEAQ